MLLKCIRMVVHGATSSSPTADCLHRGESLGVASSGSLRDDQQQHPNSCYTLDVPKSVTVKDVKDKLHRLIGAPNYLIRIFFRAVELKNHWNLYFIPSNEYVLFTVSSLSGDSQSDMQLCGPHSFNALPMHRQRKLLDALREAQEGLNSGLKPLLSMEGSGGTYFLRNTNKQKVACFKPKDEEPSAPNNPRGLVSSLGSPSLREGILSGEATAREVACFLTDTGGFCGVPPTALVEAIHPGFSYLDVQSAAGTGAPHDLSDSKAHHVGPYPKLGSLQVFVDADDFASDLSPSLFPASEVHKIALLDIRMLNCDRNDANILVKRCKRYTLSDRCPSCQVGLSRRSRMGSLDSVDSMTWASARSPRMPTGGSAFHFEGAGDDSSLSGFEMLEASRPPSPFETGQGCWEDDQSVDLGPCTCSYADKYFLQLTPIDHGYCLPSKIKVAWWDWCWIDWAQTDVPFDSATRRWVAALDPDKDAQVLRHELNIREECLKNMKMSTILLKKAVEGGLVLREIAHLIARSDPDEPSVLECQIERAHELALLMCRNSRVKGHRRSQENLISLASSATSTTPSPPAKSRRDSPRHSVSSFIPLSEREGAGKLKSLPLMRVQSFQEGKMQAAFKEESHKVIRLHGTPVRVPDAKEKSSFGNGDQVVPLIAGQEREHGSSEEDKLVDAYFFAYYDRLLDDVIQSVLARSLIDPSLRVYGNGEVPLEEVDLPCKKKATESRSCAPAIPVQVKPLVSAPDGPVGKPALRVDTQAPQRDPGRSGTKQGISYSLRGYVSPRIVPTMGKDVRMIIESPTNRSHKGREDTLKMDPISLPTSIVETVHQAKQSMMNSFRAFA